MASVVERASGDICVCRKAEGKVTQVASDPMTLAAKDCSGGFACSCQCLRCTEDSRHLHTPAGAEEIGQQASEGVLLMTAICVFADTSWSGRTGTWKGEKGHCRAVAKGAPVLMSTTWARGEDAGLQGEGKSSSGERASHKA